MSSNTVRRRGGSAFAILIASLVLIPAAAWAAADESTVDVVVDQAKVIKIPERVTTIIVGNPLIADVTLQPGGMVIVTGKGYGSTNMIAMDRTGTVLADRAIQVEGPSEKMVTVFRGVERESYSCTPVCQKRVTLGDNKDYFEAVLGQTGNLNGQASGAAAAKQ
jgi:Flp pilus assembly secretin CpaC